MRKIYQGPERAIVSHNSTFSPETENNAMALENFEVVKSTILSLRAQVQSAIITVWKMPNPVTS
jgi:hypothetical protein